MIVCRRAQLAAASRSYFLSHETHKHFARKGHYRAGQTPLDLPDMASWYLRPTTAALCAATVLLACTSGVWAQGSASVAASGNAQATASTNGNTISVTGHPCYLPAKPWLRRYSNRGLHMAYAFASGTPIANVVVQWGLGQKYVPLNLCTGSNITFEWNTGSASEIYGLYQIASSTCPSSFADQKLLVTPASSPSATSQVAINLARAGPVSKLRLLPGCDIRCMQSRQHLACLRLNVNMSWHRLEAKQSVSAGQANAYCEDHGRLH
ncbi:hypothetical protein MMC29_006280 [Sticta canariensis]|nr:hypothetical protein [Sticta canariensis]